MSAGFYLVGPTASGKSAVALALAERIGGEIINADAFQLYRELPIATAQPTPEEKRRVPHHLYGVLPVTEACDAQKYHSLAVPVIEDVIARGKWPLIVGGSGLYVKALTHGLAPLPPVDPVLRAEIASLTREQRVQRLLELDPEATRNVPLENDRYVSRALEVCLATGQPQSALRSQWQNNEPQFLGVLLQRERSDLLQRIEARTAAMFDAGLVDEVRRLPADSPNAAKAIGVPQVRELLAGRCTPAEARQAISIATRQYAKRQMTWFRRERGFQTISTTADASVTAIIEEILTLFPCLLHPPQATT